MKNRQENNTKTHKFYFFKLQNRTALYWTAGNQEATYGREG